MAKTFRCDVLTWAQVTRLAHRLATLVRESGFEPDVIVAIARGGTVPARLLADALDVMALSSVRVVHYLAGARRQRRARLVEPLHVAVQGKRVLVVDDVADSGETYEVACRHIARARPKGLRTAALHCKRGSAFVPDFFAETLTRWRWISYPWARDEDIRGFVRRMHPRPANAAVATRRLAREFGMRVPRRQVAVALRLQSLSGKAPPETAARRARARRASAGTRSRRRTRR